MIESDDPDDKLPPLWLALVGVVLVLAVIYLAEYLIPALPAGLQ